MSFKTFPDLIKLQAKNSNCFSGKYANDQACRRFVHFIHKEIENPIYQKIRDANVISVLFDGSTDSSVKEIELVYVRLLENGIPNNVYFRLAHIDDASAEGVLRAIEGVFESAELFDWKEKLVAIGSDGASVNIGKKKGISALLTNQKNHVVTMHCVAHRLELAVLDVVKSDQNLKYVSEMLYLLYKHYHYSPKALGEMKRVAEALNLSCLKPVRSSGTRWTPHMHQALQILIKSFAAIMAHMETVASVEYKATPEVKGRAKNIVNHLTQFKTLQFIHFLLDVLEIISVLSLNFQKNAVSLAEVLSSISTADLKLTELKYSAGSYLQEFHSKLKQDGPTGIFTYEGIDIKSVVQDDVLQIENFNLTQHEFIDKIIEAISKRIENIRDVPILEASAKISDPNEWPQGKSELASFGKREIKEVLNYFKDLAFIKSCDSEKLLAEEWPAFKVWASKQQRRDWKRLFTDDFLRSKYENLIKLFEVIYVFPLSTAECERGFSLLKRIKNDWRSSLSVDMTHGLMLIVNHGPKLEDYDPTEAVIKWWQGGKRKRRPGFTAYSQSVDDEPEDSENDIIEIDYTEINQNQNYTELEQEEIMELE